MPSRFDMSHRPRASRRLGASRLGKSRQSRRICCSFSSLPVPGQAQNNDVGWSFHVQWPREGRRQASHTRNCVASAGYGMGRRVGMMKRPERLTPWKQPTRQTWGGFRVFKRSSRQWRVEMFRLATQAVSAHAQFPPSLARPRRPYSGLADRAQRNRAAR